jgi:hypothetical protein
MIILISLEILQPMEVKHVKSLWRFFTDVRTRRWYVSMLWKDHSIFILICAFISLLLFFQIPNLEYRSQGMKTIRLACWINKHQASTSVGAIFTSENKVGAKGSSGSKSARGGQAGSEMF